MFPIKRFLLNAFFTVIFNFEYSLSFDHLIQQSLGFMGGAPLLAKLGGNRPCGKGDVMF